MWERKQLPLKEDQWRSNPWKKGTFKLEKENEKDIEFIGILLMTDPEIQGIQSKGFRKCGRWCQKKKCSEPYGNYRLEVGG